MGTKLRKIFHRYPMAGSDKTQKGRLCGPSLRVKLGISLYIIYLYTRGEASRHGQVEA